MSSAQTTHHARGVLCRHCSKPIRIPRLVSEKENAADAPQTYDGKIHYQLVSRVFVLRCRACERESVYTINQIVDITLPHVAVPQAKAAASY
jgi:hypothetical protein